MKTPLLSVTFILLCLMQATTVHAQHEYYATNAYTYPANINNGGSLFKMDSLGDNVRTLHSFDSVTGGYALGSIVSAANGKLYGTTTYGGANNQGVIFEYDPILDSFRVKLSLSVYFQYDIMQASNGKIYYTSTGSYGYLTEYDPVANTVTQLQFLPYPENPMGGLTEVNGKLYGITALGGVYGRGRIYEYDLATHAFNYIYDFNPALGCAPAAQPVYMASNGLFYGTTVWKPGVLIDSGTLYSFNPVTHAYNYLLTFPGNIGRGGYLTVGANNKIYGYGGYGTDVTGNHMGCIFEYDPVTNNIRLTHSFGNQNYGTVSAGYLTTGSSPFGGLLLASNGKMYGSNMTHSFEYDYLTDTVWPKAYPMPSQTNTNGYFCEICRKPSYKYFKTDTTNLCVSSPFTFTVHSDNAKTFSWKKNGVVLPSQADSTLTFTHVAIGDSGNYTCYMTNQCGFTETISSIRLAIDSVPVAGAITGNTSLCEGATTTLSYSLAGGGVWVSGNSGIATIGSSTGIVTGISGGTGNISYISYNTCGSTIVTVSVTVNALPVAGSISGGISVCVGGTISLSDAAAGGVWSSSNTAISVVNGSGLVSGISPGSSTIFYMVTNGCGTAIASHATAVIAPPALGTIVGPTVVCEASSIILSNTVAGGTWSSSSGTTATIDNTGTVTGTSPGNVTISYSLSNGCGNAVSTTTLTVNPLPTAGTITGQDTVCEGQSITLTNTTATGVWSSNDPGIATIDVTGTVTGTSGGSTLISYAASNSCGTATTTFPLYVKSLSSCTAGIQGISVTEGLNIYPNPNTGVFTMQVLSAVKEEVRIVISNTLGRKVKEFTATTNTVFNTILDEVPGIYILSATTTHAIYEAKLVITK